MIEPIRDALNQAGLSKNEIDDIVMVGGTTRIPKVRKGVSEFFDGRELNLQANPDEAVGDGAAILGNMIIKGTEIAF